MRTIAHISDLHFGREDPIAVEGVLRDLDDLAPSLVVVSGDLTQRARARQYAAARDFLRRISSPVLVVPGNHDISLFNPFRRFVRPLRNYCRYITEDLNPAFRDEEIAVFGINTARSFTWKSGRISREVIRRVHRGLEELDASVFKVVVTHHPFIPPPGEESAGIDLVGRAAEALAILSKGRVDLLLSGHLHHGYTGDIRRFYPDTKRSIIVAQAGTAVSHRVRNEPNAYNLVSIDGDRFGICIRRRERGRFVPFREIRYRRVEQEWREDG